MPACMPPCMPRQKDRAALTRGLSPALAVLVAVVSLIAAGCGGAGAGGGAAEGAVPEGASLVPGGVVAYTVVNTDVDSEQWQAAEALLGRFPSGADLLQEVVDGLASEGLDFETDIKPALGSELHLMVLDVPLEQGAELPAAALLRPDDGAKLVELLELVPDGRAAWRLVDGWYIVAMTQADIDRVVSGAGVSSLADNETFADLFRRITGEAVVRAYVAGSALSLARAAWAGAAAVGPRQPH